MASNIMKCKHFFHLFFCGEDTVSTMLDARDHEGLGICFLTWCMFVFNVHSFFPFDIRSKFEIKNVLRF